MICDKGCDCVVVFLHYVPLGNVVERRVRYTQTYHLICHSSSASLLSFSYFFLPTAAEERKRVEDKEYHKRYQEVLFKENQENLVRKAEERARAFAEEK